MATREEVARYANEHGVERASAKYGIRSSSVERYMRGMKSSAPKEKVSDKEKLLEQIGNRFSVDDLQMISKASTKQIGRRVVSIEGDEATFLALGDTHIGSVCTNPDHLFTAFEEAKKQGCEFCVHTGDVLEGMSARPGQIYELSHIGYSEQIKEAGRVFAELKMPMYFITGNHDAFGNNKSGVGLDVGSYLEQAIPDSHCLGVHEGIIELGGARLMLWHGEDSSSYAVSYRPQKIVEMFTGGEKPQVLFTGHTHKMLYLFERNVHILSTGCIQGQSGFMRYKRIAAHTGFWIVRMKVNKGEIVSFNPTWYPFYVKNT